MSWLYMPVGEADSLQPSGFSDGGTSAMSKKTRTAKKSSGRGSKMAGSTIARSGTMSGPLMDDAGVESFILSLADSRASHSAAPAKDLVSEMIETFGRTPFALLEKLSPNGAYWKTSQGSFPLITSDKFSGTWPRAALMSHGIAFRLPPSERLTREIGYGLLPTPAAGEWGSNTSMRRRGTTVRERILFWPTPVVSRGAYSYSSGKVRLKLEGAVRMFPTPNATDWKNRNTSNRKSELSKEIGGSLNPMWVEWLMGWPIGWTDLEPLETDKFRQWLLGHGIY